jgi:hypothetical protein
MQRADLPLAATPAAGELRRDPAEIFELGQLRFGGLCSPK